MHSQRIIIIRNAAKTDFGGGERFPIFLASALRELGWGPLVISGSNKLLRFAKASGVPHVRGWWWSHQRWSGPRVLLTPLYIAWQFLLFFRYLLTFFHYRPKVVHIQSKDDFIAATMAARSVGALVIWTDHADLKHIWQNVCVWYKNPVGKMVLFAARFAHAITVVSKSEKKEVATNLRKSGHIAKKIVVVHNGVFDTRDKYVNQGSDEMVRFVIASRLVVDKGISEAVGAFLQLSQKYKNISLTVLGDGPDRKHLTTLPGSEKVTFMGHVDNPLEHLAAADVFVHPTYHEGFSIALVEASMMGLPIIATSVGGNVEIIHDHKTGLLVPPRDTLGLYGAMEEMIVDKSGRQRYGTNARNQYVRQFEFNKIVKEQFLSLYRGGWA